MVKSSGQWISHSIKVDLIFSDRIIIKIWSVSPIFLRKLNNSGKELITRVNGIPIPTLYSVDLNRRLCSPFYHGKNLYFSNP